MAGNGKTPKDLIVVGALAGAHGVRGDVRVKSFTADPEDLFAYGPLLGADGEIVLEPRTVKLAKAHFIVTPKSVLNREAWEALKGTRLHVPRDALPSPEEDEAYIDDLQGLEAVSPEGVRLGRVKAVQNYGAGDLLEIAPEGGGKTVLVPFTEQDVPAFSLDDRELVVADWALWSDPGDKEKAPPGGGDAE